VFPVHALEPHAEVGDCGCIRATRRLAAPFRRSSVHPKSRAGSGGKYTGATRTRSRNTIIDRPQPRRSRSPSPASSETPATFPDLRSTPPGHAPTSAARRKQSQPSRVRATPLEVRCTADSLAKRRVWDLSSTGYATQVDPPPLIASGLSYRTSNVSPTRPRITINSHQ
jgi:hypothetical protein